MTLDALRFDLAERSRWNIGYAAAGFVYWTFVTTTALTLPVQTARLVWAIGGGCLFPLSVLLSRALGADPFSKGNPLGSLVAAAHAGSIWLLMPLIVLFYFRFPEGLLLAVAICLCVSYAVLSWAFGTQLFLWHAVIRVVGVTAIWFAVPSQRDVVIPAFVAVVYLATTAALPSQRRTWMHSHAALAQR